MNITKKNAKAAWDAGCSDVKKVLEALFPEMEFTPPMKYKKGTKIKIIVEVEVIKTDDSEDYPYRICSKEVGNYDDDPLIDTWVSEETINETISK